MTPDAYIQFEWVQSSAPQTPKLERHPESLIPLNGRHYRLFRRTSWRSRGPRSNPPRSCSQAWAQTAYFVLTLAVTAC